MCLFKVKEEHDYYEPPTRPRKHRHRRAPSMRESPTYVRRHIVEERRPLDRQQSPPPPPPEIPFAPPFPRSDFMSPPPPPSVPKSILREETVRSSSRAPSHAANTVRSRSRTASIRSKSHFVEVDHDSSSSDSSSEDVVRSKSTKRTSASQSPTYIYTSPSRAPSTAPSKAMSSATTRVGSVAPSRTEYVARERETRRERRLSRPIDGYDTYRYIDAPGSRRDSRGR